MHVIKKVRIRIQTGKIAGSRIPEVVRFWVMNWNSRQMGRMCRVRCRPLSPSPTGRRGAPGVSAPSLRDRVHPILQILYMLMDTDTSYTLGIVHITLSLLWTISSEKWLSVYFYIYFLVAEILLSVRARLYLSYKIRLVNAWWLFFISVFCILCSLSSRYTVIMMTLF